MAIGPGKYDDLCTHARTEAKAEAAILIIIRGNKGSGFSCQADATTTRALPDMLELLASQIRGDMR